MTQPYSLTTIQDQIWKGITEAISIAQNNGQLPICELPFKSIEHPQNPSHGDYSSNIALRLAKPLKMNPMKIVEIIKDLFKVKMPIESISAAKPGFLNFTLDPAWVKSQINKVIELGESFGNISLGAGMEIQVEFVSVNPTGPLHIGHARGAVVGSSLSNILTAADYQVHKEYYLNDAGAQIEKFAMSIFANYKNQKGIVTKIPDDGYQGEYIDEVTSTIEADLGPEIDKMSDQEALNTIKDAGLELMIKAIKHDLITLRVEMDEWFSETSLYENGTYNEVKSKLNDNNLLLKKDNALWFTSSKLGDDKDNVVEKSNGNPTYFASDIAYHYNKFKIRDFKFVVNIWGSDHQGHIPRLKTVMQALEIDPSRLKFIITQMVKLKRGSTAVKMSKRTGELITLSDFIKEVGVDACRFFFLSRSADSQLDFDIELAKLKSSDNPVYYIQYAHARICSIIRNAKQQKIDFLNGNVDLLDHSTELDLIKKILNMPEIIRLISLRLEPHHLAHYALELAAAFHLYYQNCKVISTDTSEFELTKARLKLCEASRLTINRCLNLMGMAAPKEM